MRLFNERKRLARLADAEAKGESFWTKRFDQKTRVKVVYAFGDAVQGDRQGRAAYARQLVLKDEGLLNLTGRSDPIEDFYAYVAECSDDMFPTVIEAMDAACFVHLEFSPRGDPWVFRERVKETLANHRVAYDLVDGQMVEFESKELHSEVVEPTLRLLAGKPGWQLVEMAYQKALHELSKGDPADAITDAGTALQEAFVLCGCKGNALGPLAKDARSKGLLAPHDQTLTDALVKVIDWVQADRSTTGDAHNAVPATRHDAWLTIHIVGALILRLSTGEPR